MYGNRKEKFADPFNVLDQWILAKLAGLKMEVTEKMDAYKLAEASRPILDFVTELSQWYVRRSRDRIKEKNPEVLLTLRHVLLELAKVSAPFVPFMAEYTYKELSGELESVHLEDWPESAKRKTQSEKKLLDDMEAARKVVETALSIRKELNIKVRQPLGELRIMNYELRKKIAEIVAEEINVKKIETVKKLPGSTEWAIKDNVALNTEITPELREEGAVREIVRAINALRKESGLTPNDEIILYIDDAVEKLFKKFQDEIAKSTVSKKIIFEKKELKHADEVKLDDKNIWVGIEGK